MFGGLDLFGKDVGVTWTKLGSIASMGDRQIVLAENVSWAVGDEIVIGPSHYDAWETETFMITAVSGDGMTLTLNESLKYDHLGLYFFIMKKHRFLFQILNNSHLFGSFVIGSLTDPFMPGVP